MPDLLEIHSGELPEPGAGRTYRTVPDHAAAQNGAALPIRPRTVSAPLPIVRVGAGVGSDDASCARHEQLKARVTDRIDRPRRAREGRADFLLRPVLAALDEIEVQGRSKPDVLHRLTKFRDQFDEPEIRWIRNAVANYPDLPADGLVPEPGVWVRRGTADGELRELYSWGRGYVTPDRKQRVFVFLAFAGASGRPVAPAKIAIAAFTTAFGTACAWPREWSAPFQPTNTPDVAPDRVRVCQVGLLDGSMKTLFEGTPERARAAYERSGRAAAESVITESVATPGRPCGGCKAVDTCSAIHQAPGLLGITMPSTPLRKVSATTLRYHEACPRQARLWSLHLSSDVQEGDRIQVGRVVDGLLDDAHRGDDLPRCTGALTDEYLPKTLDADGRVRATKLVTYHAAVCPWNSGSDVTDARVQHEVVAFDPAASAVVSARPDLLYREDGDLVWRETTTSKAPPAADKHLLGTHKRIQIALAVLLCHAGALGESVARIELEYLTDVGPDLRYLDPSDPHTVTAARAVVEPVARRWRQDQSFQPLPGSACRTCSYVQWCPDAVRDKEIS